MLFQIIYIKKMSNSYQSLYWRSAESGCAIHFPKLTSLPFLPSSQWTSQYYYYTAFIQCQRFKQCVKIPVRVCLILSKEIVLHTPLSPVHTCQETSAGSIRHLARVYASWSHRSRLLSDVHAGKPAANQLLINTLSQWRAAVPLSDHNSSAGEIAVLTSARQYNGSNWS